MSRKTKESVQGKQGTRGHAIVELALMSPWIFVLFMGILDFGFYSYAAISVENAARAAALYTSVAGLPGDSQGACNYVSQELKNMSNAASFASDCSAAPLVVTAAAATVAGVPGTQVTVAYTTINMFPLPWLPGVYRITRVVSMRQ